MKKTTFTLLLFLSCCRLAAQCPTEISFSSQAQVDAFPVNYPGCKDIPGSVYIYVDDIEPLQGITTIGGGLLIYFAGQFPSALLQNLHGLDSLRSIGGWLSIFWNTSLVNLEGLNNLKHVGNDIEILYNPSLVNLEGLNNLKHIGGHLVIAENSALTSLEGLENLDTLPGNVFIGHFSPVPGQDPPAGNDALPISSKSK